MKYKIEDSDFVACSVFGYGQKEEMSNKIKCLFSCMKKGNTCSIKTKC